MVLKHFITHTMTHRAKNLNLQEYTQNNKSESSQNRVFNQHYNNLLRKTTAIFPSFRNISLLLTVTGERIMCLVSNVEKERFVFFLH
jgi:hypothetical protein